MGKEKLGSGATGRELTGILARLSLFKCGGGRAYFHFADLNTLVDAVITGYIIPAHLLGKPLFKMETTTSMETWCVV